MDKRDEGLRFRLELLSIWYAFGYSRGMGGMVCVLMCLESAQRPGAYGTYPMKSIAISLNNHFLNRLTHILL